MWHVILHVPSHILTQEKASLSPEQQRFATSIRNMKLSHTLFGILVIQTQPQLERLLRLPIGSLNKEIKLRNEILNLFLEYQAWF